MNRIIQSLKKDNILVITTSFPFKKNGVQGGGSFIFSLCKGLLQKYNVKVLTPYCSETKMYESWDGIEILRFKYLPFSRHEIFKNGFSQTLKEKKVFYLVLPFLVISFLFHISINVRKYKIKLIHAHWIIPQGLLAIIFNRLIDRKVKTLLTVHGSDLNNFSKGIFRPLIRFILKNADTVTVVSKQLNKTVQEIYCKKTYPIIPMGVDVSKFKYVEHPINCNELLFIGRLSREKGCQYIINALPYVLKEAPNTFITVIGDGVLKYELEESVWNLKIVDNVNFMGFIQNDELPDYYRRSKCLLMPSISEGSPVVLAEAMCAGSLILTSDIPVFKDTIVYGHTGFYTSVSDPKKYAKEILRVMAIPERKDRNIRKKVVKYANEKFSWEIIQDRFIKEIEIMLR